MHIYYCQASNGNYLSFIKIPAWLSVIFRAEFAKALVLHTDHLGTLDNYNARSKFPSHSSTLMKNSIRWDGGGGGESITFFCLEAHCVLGFIFSLAGIFRASFSKDDK